MVSSDAVQNFQLHPGVMVAGAFIAEKAKGRRSRATLKDFSLDRLRENGSLRRLESEILFERRSNKSLDEVLPDSIREIAAKSRSAKQGQIRAGGGFKPDAMTKGPSSFALIDRAENEIVARSLLRMNRLFCCFLVIMTVFGTHIRIAQAQSVPTLDLLIKRMTVEVVRQKKTRVEGGDFDDKKDRITLKLKFTNPDAKYDIGGLKGEVFVFGDPQDSMAAFKLLQRQTFDLSIAARSTAEQLTNEVMTEYDNKAYSKWGVKYGGWAVILKDGAGMIVLTKSSNPGYIKDLAKLQTLEVDKFYTRDYRETTM